MREDLATPRILPYRKHYVDVKCEDDPVNDVVNDSKAFCTKGLLPEEIRFGRLSVW